MQRAREPTLHFHFVSGGDAKSTFGNDRVVLVALASFPCDLAGMRPAHLPFDGSLSVNRSSSDPVDRRRQMGKRLQYQ